MADPPPLAVNVNAGGRVPRNLVVCCDGTNNAFDDQTNVAIIAQLIAPHTGTETKREQKVYYNRGVGTASIAPRVFKFSQHFDMLLGLAAGLGMARDIKSAYRFLVDHYQPGDDIYLFGFSRGAYTVRALAGLVKKCGILKPENGVLIDHAFDLYRDKAKYQANTFDRFAKAFSHRTPGQSNPAETEQPRDIHFIGVFDTVNSVGIMPLYKYRFDDHILNKTIPYAYQALAIHETRSFFQPCLWDRPESSDQVIIQRWFTGCHSDVGGGYWRSETKMQHPWEDGDQASRLPLMWMIKAAQRHGLGIKTSTAYSPRLRDYAPSPVRFRLTHSMVERHRGKMRVPTPWAIGGSWPRTVSEYNTPREPLRTKFRLLLLRLVPSFLPRGGKYPKLNLTQSLRNAPWIDASVFANIDDNGREEHREDEETAGRLLWGAILILAGGLVAGLCVFAAARAVWSLFP